MSAPDGRIDADTGVRWRAVADAAQLHRTACQSIGNAAARAIKERGKFLIVLAGGDTPRGVYKLLRTSTADWSRWHVYWGDERCVPANDAERNSKMAADIWLDHVPIPRNQVHTILAEQGASAAARTYADTLRNIGDFDLVLLGLGADGHTASLFPKHDWGDAPDAPDALAVFDSPTPSSQRVSLSATRLSRAREVLFLVAGESKREAVTRWRSGEPLPAAAIRPVAGVDVLVESGLLAIEPVTPAAPSRVRRRYRP
ncbi:MAG: 6-phosphogluconolactonase [Pseudomonadota bacterium]|nr:6-phosphogluconolactonase [Pseudomonadota bacterium]